MANYLSGALLCIDRPTIIEVSDVYVHIWLTPSHGHVENLGKWIVMHGATLPKLKDDTKGDRRIRIQ